MGPSAVTAIARRPDRLAELADRGAHTIICDVVDAEKLEQAINEAVDCSGKLTALVYCAVSSVSALRPGPGIVAYSVAKAGLNALITGMAKELGLRRAVGVAPGWIDTEMNQAFKHVYSEDFQVALDQRSPAGIATVDSVVNAIEFLLSDKACNIPGEMLTMDGGAIL